MKATQWGRLQELVDRTAELPVDSRDAYLNEACGDDEGLRRQVAEMVAAYEQTERPFVEAIGSLASRAIAPSELAEGDRIGPYRIMGTIGHGGMGTVYRAQRSDDQFRQIVAIKVVRSSFGDSQELFARFRSERQILANINHPNIASLLDGGVTPNGLPYLVMEYIDGTNLDEYAKQHQLTTEARLHLFRQLCAAIHHAHQNLIVHRDLKPANVIVAADGTPKLLDFGIAKLLTPELSGDDTTIFTRPAERLMTPEYASPEQIRGETITTATDVYGLGVLLYELLTGTRPFRIAKLSPAEIERLICDTTPTPPSAANRSMSTSFFRQRSSTDLDRIVLKALHKIPSRRYASASDLSADVERYLSGFPVIARPDSFGYRARRFVGRHTIGVTAAVLFLLTIVGLSIGLEIQAKRARREAQSADAVSQFLVGLFQLSRPDSTQGRSVSARDILDQGTEHLGADWKGQPAVKARLLSTLGNVYQQLGAVDRSTSLLTQAEAIYTSERDSDPIELAETANALGTVLLDKGDFEHAAEQFNKALKIFEKEKGSNSAQFAEILSGLGVTAIELGKYDEAEAYQRRAIAIVTRVLGPDNEETLNEKHSLASIVLQRGNYRAAEPMMRDVLAADRKAFGDYNRHTAGDLNSLGYVLDKEGRLGESETTLRQTLAIRQKLLGVEHPEIALTMMLVGWSDREMGRFAEATSFTERALAMAQKTVGEAALNTAYDEDALALVYLDSGDPARARPLLNAALKTRLAKQRPSLSWLSQSYDHIGLVDLAEGKLVAAQGNFQHALDIRRRAYTTDNDWIAISYNHLGREQYISGDLKGALASYRVALRVARQNFGDSPHPVTIEALYGLGITSIAEKDSSSATAALKDAIAMQQKIYPPEHPNLFLATQALQTLKGSTPSAISSPWKGWIT